MIEPTLTVKRGLSGLALGGEQTLRIRKLVRSLIRSEAESYPPGVGHKRLLRLLAILTSIM